MKLTQKRLKELLDYNPKTGIFTWLISRGSIKKGNISGYVNKSTGYLIIGIDNKKNKAHRLAFLFMEGYLPENDIDHIDRNILNNKWDNLREVSHLCNMRNCNISKINKSGITGVSWRNDRKKWRSFIGVGKMINLGIFDTLIDAARARWDAEIKYNFPNCNTTSSAYMYLKENGAS